MRVRPAVRWFACVIAGVLIACAVAWGALRPPPSPVRAEERVDAYDVLVDGHRVGTVSRSGRSILSTALSRWVERRMQASGRPAVPAQKVEYVPRTGAARADLQPAGELFAKVRDSITMVAPATAIVVDGEPVVALEDPERAGRVIDAVLEDYLEEAELRAAREHAGDLVSYRCCEHAVMEDVSIERIRVPLDEIKDEPAARAILERGTDVERTHIVEAGETLWDIARAYDLTLEDIAAANPDLGDLDLIRAGDSISLVVPEPYITIRSVEEATYSQPVSFSTRVVYSKELWPWQRVVKRWGSPGEKLVTMRITRVNGRPENAVKIAERVVRQPVQQVVAQGTRPIPQTGTGAMVWPLSGRITSTYGPRWGGFHSGVDIAAPVGTPIAAADTGVVVAVGWSGGYGRRIIIDHGGGVTTLYAHLSRYLVDVGDKVEKGSRIGLVGSTGRSTGPHLHFEIRVDGRAVDPMEYFKRSAE